MNYLNINISETTTTTTSKIAERLDYGKKDMYDIINESDKVVTF